MQTETYSSYILDPLVVGKEAQKSTGHGPVTPRNDYNV